MTKETETIMTENEPTRKDLILPDPHFSCFFPAPIGTSQKSGRPNFTNANKTINIEKTIYAIK